MLKNRCLLFKILNFLSQLWICLRILISVFRLLLQLSFNISEFLHKGFCHFVFTLLVLSFYFFNLLFQLIHLVSSFLIFLESCLKSLLHLVLCVFLLLAFLLFFLFQGFNLSFEFSYLGCLVLNNLVWWIIFVFKFQDFSNLLLNLLFMTICEVCFLTYCFV